MIFNDQQTKITKKSATNFSSIMCAPLVIIASYMHEEEVIAGDDLCKESSQ